MVAPAYTKEKPRYLDDQLSCSSAEQERSPYQSCKGNRQARGIPHATTKGRCRNVRFQVDEVGRDNVQTYVYEQPPVCYWSDLYWSDQEKNQFANDARFHVAEFAKRSPQRVRRMEIAFEHCSDMGVSDESQKENMRALLKWVASSGRGLEDGVSSLYSERRASYMRDMTDFFAYLSESFVPGTDITEDVRLFSECRSLRNREFSFKVALADELTL